MNIVPQVLNRNLDAATFLQDKLTKVQGVGYDEDNRSSINEVFKDGAAVMEKYAAEQRKIGGPQQNFQEGTLAMFTGEENGYESQC